MARCQNINVKGVIMSYARHTYDTDFLVICPRCHETKYINKTIKLVVNAPRECLKCGIEFDSRGIITEDINGRK